MKFRNPKTGEIYETKGKFEYVGFYQFVNSGFCEGKVCKECPISSGMREENCAGWVENHPYEAANLMGYEVLTDEEESLYRTECPECGSNNIERELGTRHWTCHKCGWENKPDRTAKADGGKPRPTLVPPSLMEAVTAVREYGCSKYHDPDNWKRVEPQRYRDAAYRHWLAYLKDPHSVDEESGLPHLWHLACNVAFLIDLEKPNKNESKMKEEIKQLKQMHEKWDALWRETEDTPRT